MARVEWHRQGGDGATLMKKGEAIGNGGERRFSADPSRFVGVAEIVERISSHRKSRREAWETYIEQLRQDDRVVALHRIGLPSENDRDLPNLANPKIGNGTLVAGTRVDDRWGRTGGAIDFGPTGSRVRLSIPGEFQSLTFLAWVKINRLDRRYNSLFLTDGHEQFEPHWQIMSDGRLFFSVKKRDRWDSSKGEKDKHIYFSDPFWKPSLSGQWLMLATTYDVENKAVSHFLNGERISVEGIPAEYLVETVRIGNASLANWGQPERNEPGFAIRNLNGSLHEFVLFRSALTAEEITEIYQHGKL